MLLDAGLTYSCLLNFRWFLCLACHPFQSVTSHIAFINIVLDILSWFSSQSTLLLFQAFRQHWSADISSTDIFHQGRNPQARHDIWLRRVCVTKVSYLILLWFQFHGKCEYFSCIFLLVSLLCSPKQFEWYWSWITTMAFNHQIQNAEIVRYDFEHYISFMSFVHWIDYCNFLLFGVNWFWCQAIL